MVDVHIRWQNRYINDLVRAQSRGIIRDAVSQFKIDEVISAKRFAMVQYVSEKLISKFSDNGLIMVDFVLRNITFSPEYAASIEQKQIAEQQAKQAFYVVESVHGNGFIASYFAGMLLGTRTESIRERIQESGEAESQALVLFIFLLFGMILVPFSFPLWDWRTLVYALLSLTVIRMVPVALSLIGTGLNQKTVWFIGWFGPRGIASVLYLLMMVIQLGTDGYELVIAIITLTVLLSIFLHGITAMPFSKLFQENAKSN